MAATKYWMGPPPQKCDTCPKPITEQFVDGKTSMGPWANMCPACFKRGPGLNRLGLGVGQQYTKQADGRFAKTGG